jgi:hypothetical protein
MPETITYEVGPHQTKILLCLHLQLPSLWNYKHHNLDVCKLLSLTYFATAA